MSQALIAQAQEAVRTANWTKLSHYLQQASSAPGENRGNCAPPAGVYPSGPSPRLEASSSQALLNLALGAFEQGDFQTRWEIAKILPSAGPGAIAPLGKRLAEAIEDEDWDLAWFIARLLGEFRHPDAAALLVGLLQAPPHEDLGSMAASALAHLGDLAIAPLTAQLHHASSRLLAVQALAQISHPTVTDALLSVVADPDPAVRTVAIAALEHLQDERCIPALVRACADPVAAVRRAAVTSLGGYGQHLGEAPFVRLLAPHLRDFDLEVCRQAALSLGRLPSSSAAAALAEVLRSPPTPLPLQLDLVRALVWLEIPESLTYLEGYRDEWRPQQTRTFQGGTTPARLWIATAELLGQIRRNDLKPGATRYLQALLTDPPALTPASAPLATDWLGELKRAIALSLGQLAQESAIPTLLALLDDADARVRLHAIAALKRFGMMEF
ncbi:MAG: HEAT repeat domain-containing protein [Synechococcales bacterium]|nr:HEAT repeat domain-containing protein [Synechococcales bacterium]